MEGGTTNDSWRFLADPISLTGFDVAALEIIFRKYSTLNYPNSPIKTRKELALFLEYYKTYPTIRVFAANRGLKSFRSLLSRIKAIETFLYNHVEELLHLWQNRFFAQNMVPDVMGDRITGIIDGTPVYIERPKRNQHLFYSGKYKKHVVKFQAIADNKRNIIWYTGPHFGKSHDISKFYRNLPILEEGERILGDKGYCGCRAQQYGAIAPFKKPRGRNLTERQKAYNRLHAFHRAKVEHAFAYIKRFNILGHRYRGGLQGLCRLQKAAKILINLNSYMTNRQ